MTETRQQKEQRLAREYAAYVDKCKSEGFEPLNYMNWAASKKFDDNN